MRRFLFIFFTVLLGALAAAVAWYAFYFKPNMIAAAISKSPKPVETVAAAAVAPDMWQGEIRAIGTTVAPQGVNIMPEVNGMVVKLGFDSGQYVEKGTVLAVLDATAEQAQLQNLTVQLGNAQRDLDRGKALQRKGFMAKADIDKLTTARDALKANVDQTEAIIAKKTITAPFAGALGLRQVSMGSYAAPGNPIVWIQQVDPIYVDFTVTEADYGSIKTGQSFTAGFDAMPGQSFKGALTATDARISAASRMITVRGELANADHRLLPGMYANVRVAAGETRPVLTLPQTAITYSLYGNSVLKVVPASTIDKDAKPEQLAVVSAIVKTGAVKDGKVEVTEGLAAGDQVVIAGQNKVSQGSYIVINNDISLTPPANPAE
ncbi:MAG TPA: efflux RND transporter periplasmic adaptor subunit [Aestuariivirga sp.]|nr:efflux RND transporter periplasmic adaptor subunit [Aestuariivirga sp.]